MYRPESPGFERGGRRVGGEGRVGGVGLGVGGGGGRRRRGKGGAGIGLPCLGETCGRLDLGRYQNV